MKRKILFTLIGLSILLISSVTIYKYAKPKEAKKNITKIRLAEVTHSAFYAPFYVAIENGYFEEQGIEIELILTPGADKVSAAVLSNDVEVGFAGAESAIYVYDGGEKDYLQLFSGLTKRDGQFIVSREENKDFTLDELKGKEILVGRAGGMPALNFLNALKKSNINPKEMNLNYSVEFAALSGSFVSGVGDYVNLFEPTATAVTKEGFGSIVASIGLLSGEVPYTAFYARKSFINNNKDLLNKFVVAIDMGLSYVNSKDPERIAKVISPQFSSISLDDLTKIITNYQNADSWLTNPFISESSLENLENIMIDNSLLDEYVPYNNLVFNLYNE